MNDTESKPSETLNEPSVGQNGLSPNFEWKLEYDDKIEKTAADNLVQEWDWLLMRDAIKRRIHQVLAAFLASQQSAQPPARSIVLSPDATLVGHQVPIAISPSVIEQRPGQHVYPLPRRATDEKLMPSKMGAAELNEEMDRVFGMLNEFDDHPPFTIQRVCELLVRPSVYKSVGKYIRALERTLLVTSTADQYATDTFSHPTIPSANDTFSDGALKLAMTPLFSPIPFLHPDMDPETGQPVRNGRTAADAAPSPMMLNDDDIPPPSPRLGLVDELDDPSADSNHLADRPQALTSTTTVVGRVVEMDEMDMDEADLFGSSIVDLGFGPTGVVVPPIPTTPTAAAQGGSLNDRFVRSTTPEPETGRALFNRDRDEVVANGRGGKLEEEAAKDKDTEMEVDEPKKEE